jgi:dihydroceramidase
MQLVDELSMIYTTCIMFYATFSYRKSALYVTILGTFLVALAGFITGYYHYLQDPTFHQNMYALLTAIVLLRAMYIMEINIRPSLRAKELAINQGPVNGEPSSTEIAEQKRKDTRDVKILKTMWAMIAYGLSIFLGGFAVWSLDNVYCGTLRRWRREIGLPWGVLLEGHGWWYAALFSF